MVKGWEVSLPSTCSNHVPITINLASPTLIPSPKHPGWSDTDWETLSPVIKTFQIPAAPPCLLPTDLDGWLAWWLDRLTALLKEYTPVSRASQHTKTWWSPHPTTLRREFHKGSSLARKDGTPALPEVANISRAGYFKAIKTTKNKPWSSLLLGATPQNLWTAKRLA